MPAPDAGARLSGIHAEILGRLQRQFARSLYEMEQHIDAAGLAAPDDARYHLEQALEAATSSRVTLHQISQYCGALETAIS